MPYSREISPGGKHPVVGKQVYRDIAYYRLDWTPLLPVDRHRINSTVPSLPGIWEIYWLENSRSPRLLKMGQAWYGGLRNELRLEADGEDIRNRDMKEKLLSGDAYYRYTVCEAARDLEEVFDTLLSIRGLQAGEGPASRRYRDVRISEDDEMIIHRIRTPSQPRRKEESFSNPVPNMFDVVKEMRSSGQLPPESKKSDN